MDAVDTDSVGRARVRGFWSGEPGLRAWTSAHSTHDVLDPPVRSTGSREEFEDERDESIPSRDVRMLRPFSNGPHDLLGGAGR